MPKTTAKVLLFGSHYLMESFKGDHMVTGDSPAMGATCRVYKRPYMGSDVKIHFWRMSLNEPERYRTLCPIYFDNVRVGIFFFRTSASMGKFQKTLDWAQYFVQNVDSKLNPKVFLVIHCDSRNNFDAMVPQLEQFARNHDAIYYVTNNDIFADEMNSLMDDLLQNIVHNKTLVKPLKSSKTQESLINKAHSLLSKDS